MPDMRAASRLLVYDEAAAPFSEAATSEAVLIVKWDQAATWEACVRRLEELQSVPADRRTEAEERARYALQTWVEQHAR